MVTNRRHGGTRALGPELGAPGDGRRGDGSGAGQSGDHAEGIGQGSAESDSGPPPNPFAGTKGDPDPVPYGSGPGSLLGEAGGQGRPVRRPACGGAGGAGASRQADGAKAPSAPRWGDSPSSLPRGNQKAPLAPRRPRQPWSPGDRETAIAAYADLGSVKEAAEATGVPLGTLERWLAAPEAAQAVEAIRKQHSRRRSLEAGSLWDRAVTELRDRLDHGDHVLTKQGDVVRKPIAGRDLAVIAGIMADKTAQWGDWAAEATGSGSNVTPDQFLDVLSNIETLRAELARRQAAKREIEVVAEPFSPPTRVERPGRKVREDADSRRPAPDAEGGR